MEDTITVAEGATLVGKSVPTVSRAVRAGRIPVVKKLPGANGAYLLHPADVLKAFGVEEPAA